jgi:hypothetical protein
MAGYRKFCYEHNMRLSENMTGQQLVYADGACFLR